MGATKAIQREILYRRPDTPRVIELLKLQNEYAACLVFNLCLLTVGLISSIAISVLRLSSSAARILLIKSKALSLIRDGLWVLLATGILGQEIAKRKDNIELLEFNGR